MIFVASCHGSFSWARLRLAPTAGCLCSDGAVHRGCCVAFSPSGAVDWGRWCSRRSADGAACGGGAGRRRFAEGAAPTKKCGRPYAAECWKDLVRIALAWGIAAIIIWKVTIVVADPGRTQALWGIHRIFIIWFAADGIWAINYTLWLRKKPAAAEHVLADR